MEVESQLAMNCVNKKIKLYFFGGGQNVKLQETYKGKAEKNYFRTSSNVGIAASIKIRHN